MILMTGEDINQEIRTNLKSEIKGYMIKPCLAIIQIGDNKNCYIDEKIKACNEVGIYLKHILFDDNTKEIEIINKIIELNNDDYVNGILLCLPFPEKYNTDRLINYIARNKDVGGLTDLSVGKLFNNKKTFVPPIASTIMALCKHYEINLSGKHAVVIDKSSLIGKPMISLLIEQEAIVTISKPKSEGIDKIISSADIIITASDIKTMIVGSKIKKGTAIFDMTIIEDDNLSGDTAYEEIKDKIAYIATSASKEITSVIVSMLLNNVIEAYRKMNNI